MQSSSAWVVIPAAGIGQRMQVECPKQYLRIHDKTIIEHTLNCFRSHEEIAGIVVVISQDDDYWQSLDLSDYELPIHTVLGGVNRSDSVSEGLKYLSDQVKVSENTWVLVHDAARPCLGTTDLDSLLALRNEPECDGGILASPVRDTMKRAISSSKDNDYKTIETTEPREGLWHALTPQLFRLGKLSDALQFCKKKQLAVTDECSAMENVGAQTMIVVGSPNNIKVTYASDLEMASYLLKRQAT